MAVRFGRAFNYCPAKHPIHEWKACIKAFALPHKPDRALSGPLRVDLTFYMPRPSAHFGTGKNRDVMKPSAPSYCLSRPDRDNLDKALLDVMTELVFWIDDSQVCDGRIIKRYGPAVFLSGQKHNGCYVRIRECRTEKASLLENPV